MKLSKSGVFGLILSFLCPLLSIVFSFMNIKRENYRLMNVAISISVFSIILTIPPYQDLYRRYIENYLSYNIQTTYIQAVAGHVDVLMYVVALFMKKHSIPFYFFPAIQAGVVNYLFLSSTRDVVESKYYLGGKRIPYLLSFLFINILAGALGIRFYMAVALFTKGLTLYLFRGRFNSAVIFLFLSVMFHFSAALPIIALFTSRIVKLKYRFVPFYFLMGFVFGSFLLLDIINSGVLGYLGQYIKSGYIDFSTNADVDTKGNAIVVTVWRYFILLFLYIPCYKLYNKKNDDTGFLNFIGVYFVICSLTAISFNAFNRYIIAYGSFFVLLNCFIVMNFRVKKIQINIFIFILVFNFLFQNIYLQRRPILFGEMWKGLYMPFLINIEKSDYDFKIQMNQIDENGDWIKDRVASE